MGGPSWHLYRRCLENLGNGLETQYAAASELQQPSQSVLESVNLSERVQLVDDEPQPLIAFGLAHPSKSRAAVHAEMVERRAAICPAL